MTKWKSNKLLRFKKEKKINYVLIYEGPKVVGKLFWNYRKSIWQLQQPKRYWV